MTKKGYKFTEEHKIKIGLANRKTGEILRKGYLYVLVENHPYPYILNNSKYVLKSKLILEEHLGRFLNKEEVIHHIDGNITNNNINNLMLFPNQSAHAKFHAFERGWKVKDG